MSLSKPLSLNFKDVGKSSLPCPPQREAQSKTGLAYLPYEIFLEVIDELINSVRFSELPAAWILGYQYKVPSRIVVRKIDSEGNPQYWPDLPLSRFLHTRLPSQINCQTRAMVPDKIVGPSEPTIRFRQALTHPNPQCVPLLNSIQRFFVPLGYFFSKENTKAVEAIATIPNLKAIHMSVGTVLPELRGPIIHRGLQPIDPAVYPDFHNWVAHHGSTFLSVYRPLEERGVKLYGKITENGMLAMEVISLETGIRVIYRDANCTCCSQT
nr:uncharacterized protein CTRU02_10384 [Colletotrichum truncatum]KAF6787121.1 hypothetical protein CTRU02_10384 [Colletotrichum truncatum]